MREEIKEDKELQNAISKFVNKDKEIQYKTCSFKSVENVEDTKADEVEKQEPGIRELYKEPLIKIPIITTLTRLIYWKVKDIIKAIREPKAPHLYGIYGFFGLPGYGKTMAMSKRLLDLRRRYGDQIIIMTNYGFEYEDEPFKHWEQLLETYDKPLIVAWDEIQNEFTSRSWKDFPMELLTLLTQNRKGHGKQILYTCQRYARVDKVFRELTILCYECKTIMGRLTTAKGYDWEDYEMLLNNTDVNKKMKIRPRAKEKFIQTDFIRNCYNSYQMLQSARDKMKTGGYMDRTEIAMLTK